MKHLILVFALVLSCPPSRAERMEDLDLPRMREAINEVANHFGVILLERETPHGPQVVVMLADMTSHYFNTPTALKSARKLIELIPHRTLELPRNAALALLQLPAVRSVISEAYHSKFYVDANQQRQQATNFRVDTGIEDTLVAKLAYLRFNAFIASGFYVVAHLVGKIPGLIRTGSWPISFYRDSRYFEWAALYYALSHFEFQFASLFSHHNDKTWYKVLFHQPYGLIDVRNQISVDNALKILERPDVPILLMTMGGGHLPGFYKLFTEQHGFHEIKPENLVVEAPTLSQAALDE